VHGISPFSTEGDSVSYYLSGVDFYADTLHNFAHFSLPPPALLRAYSTDETARALIASRRWSIIYIDGNHEYEVVRQDWEICARQVEPGGVIVLDDAGLGTNYRPPGFATGGHPGPSRLAKEIDGAQFREILQVGHNRAFQKIA
jgi:predicted O-methyltransferase YrrM